MNDYWRKPVTYSSQTRVVLYTTADRQHRLEVWLEDDNAWLSQRQLADLYQVGVNTINDHISQIYNDGELDKAATIRNHRIVQSEAKREVQRSIEFYDLQVVLAVGYRVRSPRGVEFRQNGGRHFRNIFIEGELDPCSAVKKFFSSVVDVISRNIPSVASRDGYLLFTGTAIAKVLPPVSRFSQSGERTQKRETVFEKFKAFLIGFGMYREGWWGSEEER